MRQFVEAASTGRLPSGLTLPLAPIPARFWEQWSTPNDDLRERGPIGGPKGKSPATPNDRATESFGSAYYRYPLMSVDKLINGPKGRIMRLGNPTQVGQIGEFADTAVETDTDQNADILLQSIRVVSKCVSHCLVTGTAWIASNKYVN